MDTLCWSFSKRERERDREIERDRETETERESERETEREDDSVNLGNGCIICTTVRTDKERSTTLSRRSKPNLSENFIV